MARARIANDEARQGEKRQQRRLQDCRKQDDADNNGKKQKVGSHQIHRISVSQLREPCGCPSKVDREAYAGYKATKALPHDRYNKQP
jgi:hypothetical protein